MIADQRFVGESKAFWANVRSISQHRGYTEGRKKAVKIHTIADMVDTMTSLGLGSGHLVDGGTTPLGSNLEAYFRYRADILNEYVQPRLMDVDRAREMFRDLKEEYCPICPLPMNKQKGEKAGNAYFTGIVNMTIERFSAGISVDYNPMELTTATYNNAPLRTLARRVDGTFPSTVNPIAIWEIKEYYHTTTFGSRIADGVFETQLDGMELQELRQSEGVNVEHLLMVDSHRTWWLKGRSYLCRIVDMLHMGYIDEVLFGAEVIERLPQIVTGWVRRHEERITNRR